MYQTAFAFGIIVCVSVTTSYGQESLPPPVGWLTPDLTVPTPGVNFNPPIDDAVIPSEGSPLIYEHSNDAGPDQSFFAVGYELTGEIFVWGRDAESIHGRRWDAKAHLVNNNYLAATLPERSYDSIFMVWVKILVLIY